MDALLPNFATKRSCQFQDLEGRWLGHIDVTQEDKADFTEDFVMM